MIERRSSRLAAVGAPVIAAALVLSACGGSDGSGSPTRDTIELNAGSTAFQTIPPATSPPTTLVPVPGDTATTEQIYTVQSGDWPLRVADLYEVSLQDLISYNGWVSEAEFPFPGTDIKIPPGGKIINADSGGAVQDGVESVTGGEAEQPVGDTIPDAGDNCQAGSYVIESGDVPISVANKFDVTVEALAAANAATNGYSAFFVGLTIVIPAKDCDE